MARAASKANQAKSKTTSKPASKAASKTAKTKKRAANRFPRRIFATASPHSLGGLSMFAADSLINAETVANFDSDPALTTAAVQRLQDAGFEILAANTAMINICGSRTAFERAFGTKLVAEERSVIKPGGQKDTATFFDTTDTDMSGYIDTSASDFADVLEGIAIEEPYYSMAQPIQPTVDSWYLTVPGGVSLALNADKAHRIGRTGRGVKVAMVDTGWFRHPFFEGRGYRSERAILSPGAENRDDDEVGHGTGESANVFAVAPDCELLPVKASTASGALVNMTAAINAAVALGPDIITNSWGASVETGPLSAARQAQAAAVAAAVASGIVVCFSAGNGHFGFPGQHPDVISVGGVFRDEDGSLQASDYASGFISKVYPGRQSPDVCGMVGLQPGASYIMLPVQDGVQIDVGKATGGGASLPDGTTNTDGWALFSGTSAACPQIAGVIALMKEACPGLNPAQIRGILKRTSIDITTGSSHPNTGGMTGPGTDTATGYGLVDAAKAVAVARLHCLLVTPPDPTPAAAFDAPVTRPQPLAPIQPFDAANPAIPLRAFLSPMASVSSPSAQASAPRPSAQEVAYLEALLIESGPGLIEG